MAHLRTVQAADYAKVELDCHGAEMAGFGLYYSGARFPLDISGASLQEAEVSGCDPSMVSDPYIKKSKIKISNKGNNSYNEYPFSVSLISQISPKLRTSKGVVKIAQKAILRKGDFSPSGEAVLSAEGHYKFTLTTDAEVRVTWAETFKNDVALMTNGYLYRRLLIARLVPADPGNPVIEFQAAGFDPLPTQTTLNLPAADYLLFVETNSQFLGIGPQNPKGYQPVFSRKIKVVVERHL